MRSRVALLILALTIPASADAQSSRRPANVERFDTAGMPAVPASELEKEIFTLLRIHKTGDYSNASRIHLLLAQYHKALGNAKLEDICNDKALKAWEAASGERPTSAGSQGSPPFDSENTFAGVFAYTDDVKVQHSWEFFFDGTYAHSLATAEQPDGTGLRERGFYTLSDGRIRLWMMKPRSDRRVSFELKGEGGKDGAVMDGIRMEWVKQ